MQICTNLRPKLWRATSLVYEMVRRILTSYGGLKMIGVVPADEAAQIQNIVDMTIKQLQHRYAGQTQVLRGVHAKDHGLVKATFEVLPCLPEGFQHGVFAVPGKRFPAVVRFSNAAVLVRPDSMLDASSGQPSHGSRGMAIKLFGVEGKSLGFVHGALTQDFLMVNHPVFVFANVEDYEVLSRALLVDNNDDPRPFFAERLPPPGTALPSPSQLRAIETRGLAGRIQSPLSPPGFQTPPASPLDNDYFGASPFMLGPQQVMRFRVRPELRGTDQPNVADPNYLRTALVARLRDQALGDVVFHFEAQVRQVAELDIEKDIENASHDWPDEFKPFAKLTIPLQEFDSPSARSHSEDLVFTPWHGLEAHEPIGSINRMRRAVYEASAAFRHLPKESSAVRCPFGH